MTGRASDGRTTAPVARPAAAKPARTADQGIPAVGGRSAPDGHSSTADAVGQPTELSRLRFELARHARRAAELETAFRLMKSDMEAELDDLRFRQTSWFSRASRAMRSYFGFGLEIVPVQGIDAADEGVEGDWVIKGATPQFALRWQGQRPLDPGHYRVTIAVPAGLEAMETPCLYAYAGRGGDRSSVLVLSKRPGSREPVIQGDVLLVGGARSLSFDPGMAGGRLSTGQASLRRMSRFESYARMGARAWRSHRRGDGTLGWAIRRAASLFRQGGVRAFAAQLRKAGNSPLSAVDDYQRWIRVHERFGQVEIGELRRRLRDMDEKPLVSVLMPVFDPALGEVRDAIDSVRGQIYGNWELCIVAEASGDAEVASLLADLASADARIRLLKVDGLQGRADALNRAFVASSGDWVIALDDRDALSPVALAEIAMTVAGDPATQVIYADEDRLTATGRRVEPHFKPDFSRELFRSQDYLGPATVHRAENVRSVGGWRPDFEGAEAQDLNLRVFELAGGARIRHLDAVLYHRRQRQDGADAGSAATVAGRKALEEHLARTGVDAVAETVPGTAGYRVRFAVPEPAPLVSLIIPTRDMVDMLRGCVESIREKTTYPRYEIIVVDNGSVEKATLDYLEEISARPNVRVLPYTKPFNYSAINNFAAARASGEIIGLINNDVEVISPEWLTEMVSWAAQPDIGCVGAKLHYGDGTIQHGGVILGLGGVAGHAHRFFPGDHPGYQSRLMLVQNLSAVTGACLLVRKRVYEEVGGLNERDLTVAYNDVDFCLKVREAGYANVWTPHAQLYHLESVSRGMDDSPEKLRRYQSEVAYMQRSWQLTPDPYYSVNLTSDREDFSLAN